MSSPPIPQRSVLKKCSTCVVQKTQFLVKCVAKFLTNLKGVQGCERTVSKVDRNLQMFMAWVTTQVWLSFHLQCLNSHGKQIYGKRGHLFLKVQNTIGLLNEQYSNNARRCAIAESWCHKKLIMWAWWSTRPRLGLGQKGQDSLALLQQAMKSKIKALWIEVH